MATEKKLIYADAGKTAAEYMKKHIVPSDSDFLRGYLAGVEALATGLENLPPVNAVEVVHAQWALYPDWRWLKCSNCKVEFEEAYFPKTKNYCPNCGAKMDGGAVDGL